jgi:hypothetical protein
LKIGSFLLSMTSFFVFLLGFLKGPLQHITIMALWKAHRKVCGNNCDLLFPLASIYVGISIFRIDQKLS